MGFLNKLFGESKEEGTPSKADWKFLEETSLDEIEKVSFERPVTIFKHSTRCSISRMALKQFEREYDVEPDQMDLYFLDLLAHRPLSNAVAERFGIIHESPQMIVIKNGKAVYNASHSGIQADDLKRLVSIQ